MALLMGLAVGMTSTAFAAENQTVQTNEQVEEVSDTAASDGNEKRKIQQTIKRYFRSGQFQRCAARSLGL